MKVILLQNIRGVGRMGDVKNVSDGYGRNYLVANKLAKIATEGTVKEAEGLKKKAESLEKIMLEKAKEVAGKAKDIVLEFTKKSSKTGKLFASITKEEIAEDLSKAIGAKVNSDSINLREHGEHLKQEGEHMIEVELTPEIKVELKVVVRGE
jgi:large subunit ribosomal protein L9